MSHQKVAHTPIAPASTRGRTPHLHDSAMRDVMERGRRFIDRGLPVLILGETGTGKEVVARALHDYSARRLQSLITLNCASIPETLVESELFGYARGAFSGALPGGMKGKIEAAHGGTLFLDEIGDMPLNQQARLLRALSEREITPLGTTRPVAVEFQLICATHQNLTELVRAGVFRADLFYRIAEGVLRLPPLRERTDFAELAQHIAEEEAGRAISLEQGAWDALRSFNWPGNVRQLRAALRCACALSKDGVLRAGDFSQDLVAHPIDFGIAPADTRAIHIAPDSRAAEKRARVLRVLAGSRWNISAAAKDLGVCRSTLYRQLKALGIPHIKDVEPGSAQRYFDYALAQS